MAANTRSVEQRLLDDVRQVKRCGVCGVEKPFSDFYWKRGTCKPCVIVKQTAYKKTPSGAEANRRRSINHTRLKNYGLTPDAYASMYAGQLGLCAICGEPETKITKTGVTQSLSVDHDHVTGAVRGLLCDRCNGLLGRARDDIGLLESAIRYLRSATYVAERD